MPSCSDASSLPSAAVDLTRVRCTALDAHDQYGGVVDAPHRDRPQHTTLHPTAPDRDRFHHTAPHRSTTHGCMTHCRGRGGLQLRTMAATAERWHRF